MGGREGGRGEGGRERERRRSEKGGEILALRLLTKLMWYFVEDEGDGGANTQREALGDGCTQRQTIGNFVESISNNDEPSQGLDPLQSSLHPLPL